MPEETKSLRPHPLRLCIWALFVVAIAFLYYRYSSLWDGELVQLAASSAWLAYAVYIALGALRGFALIPVTNLVVLAIPLFPPVPLLVLTLVGIAVSSASIYAFAGSLKLGEYLEHKHARHIGRLQNALRRNPTSIVTAWSFLPIVPTDLICYVCGVMRISFRRFLFGVLVGEGAICALYIFAGASLLDLGKRVFGADVAQAQAAAPLSGERLCRAFDTAREFETVNGVRARGSSLDGQGVVVADGVVLVASGYPRNGGMPGNVLLAFRAD